MHGQVIGLRFGSLIVAQLLILRIDDAFLVTVRNKERVGYTYELTLGVKGEWHIGGEKKKVKGPIDVPEFTSGELDDLQIQVKFGEGKDIPQDEWQRIRQDLKLFLQPLREKLFQFEEELKAWQG